MPDLRPVHPLRNDLPHIVRFSGGRSSGMMLMMMLESDMLRRDRGDVVLFSNTSAEHPATYAFVRSCARISERAGIPFFWLEYATHEVPVRGKWSRREGVRLTNSRPKTPKNRNGYRWRGEVFEEMISHTGHIPSRHARTCTNRLKIATTHAFLRHWLSGASEVPRQGHWHDDAQMRDHEVIARHKAAGGVMRPEELLRFKSAVRAADPFVPAQRFADYSKSGERGPSLSNGLGAAELFGKDAVDYLSFIGLRADERMRVANMRRNLDERTGARHGIPDGELVETPLCDAGIASDDVTEFWRRRPHLDLKLPSEANLSNCAFCFMKGAAGIRRAAAAAGNAGRFSPDPAAQQAENAVRPAVVGAARRTIQQNLPVQSPGGKRNIRILRRGRKRILRRDRQNERRCGRFAKHPHAAPATAQD